MMLLSFRQRTFKLNVDETLQLCVNALHYSMKIAFVVPRGVVPDIGRFVLGES